MLVFFSISHKNKFWVSLTILPTHYKAPLEDMPRGNPFAKGYQSYIISIPMLMIDGYIGLLGFHSKGNYTRILSSSIMGCYSQPTGSFIGCVCSWRILQPQPTGWKWVRTNLFAYYYCYCFHTVKSFQVLLSNTNYSVKY